MSMRTLVLPRAPFFRDFGGDASMAALLDSQYVRA
jgi:hypothetical protein